jgi:acetyl esterase/lipase
VIQTSENDVLCDDGGADARKLDDAGVDVINVRYNGTVHDVALPNSSLDVPAPAPPYGRPPPTPATNSAEVTAPVDPLGTPLH